MNSLPPIGFPFMPLPDAQGRLSYPRELDESVRQSIRVILTTRPGELLLHPDFGAGLDLYLNQPNTLELRQDLHDRIVESLERFEPRILVDRVDVAEDDDNPARLRVEIAYRLRRTGMPRSLAFNLMSGV